MDKVSTHLVLLNKYGWTHCFGKENKKECKICFDTMNYKYTLTTACGHTYHRHCILNNICDYSHFKCPICRKDYEIVNNKIEIEGEGEREEGEEEDCSGLCGGLFDMNDDSDEPA